MKLEAAIQQLNDGLVRKFVLDTSSNTLHVFENPFPQEADTHLALADRQGLKTSNIKGGRLRVVESSIQFTEGSTTIPTASESDIEKFKGEVEIF